MARRSFHGAEEKKKLVKSKPIQDRNSATGNGKELPHPDKGHLDKPYS